MTDKQEWIGQAMAAYDAHVAAENARLEAEAAEEARKDQEQYDACEMRFRAALQALGDPEAMTCDVWRDGKVMRPFVFLKPGIRLEGRFAWGKPGHFQGLKVVCEVGEQRQEFPGTDGAFLMDWQDEYALRFGRAMGLAKAWVEAARSELKAELERLAALAAKQAEETARAQAVEIALSRSGPANPYRGSFGFTYAGQGVATHLRDLTRYARALLALPTLPGQSVQASQRDGLKKLAFYLYQLWQQLDAWIAAQEAADRAAHDGE